VSSGKLEMGAALAVIHGGAFLAAIGLIWWRDHGTHLQLRPKRPAPMVAGT
jgi:lipopolysaccharide export system permease protein